MSKRHQDEGASAFEAGGKRADNPYSFGTRDWTDWKDGFDQAEAVRERVVVQRHIADELGAAS